MTLVRAQVVMSAASKPGLASKIGCSGLQIVGAGRMSWARKHVFLKNPPYTIESPSTAQMRQRIKFGEAAGGARGQHGLDPETGLPPAAAATHRGAAGSSGGLPPEQWPSRVQTGFHSLEQLRAKLAQQERGGGYAPGPTRGRY